MTALTFGKNAGLFHTCHRMSCVAAIEADGLQCGSFGYRTFLFVQKLTGFGERRQRIGLVER